MVLAVETFFATFLCGDKKVDEKIKICLAIIINIY